MAARREKGETIPSIAADLKVSVATARRFLTNLHNAQDVEAGKHDALWTRMRAAGQLDQPPCASLGVVTPPVV